MNPKETLLDFVPIIREGTPPTENKQRKLEFVVCWNQLSQHTIRPEIGELLKKQEELWGRL